METKEIKLPFKINRPVLALGGQAKNTVCFASGRFAYLSREHQDLSHPEDFLDFERDVKHFLKKSPMIIAYDLHPEYQSTQYALSLIPRYAAPGGTPPFSGGSSLATQHHHAHIASCMADNGLKNQKVIGVAFDGTGLGEDNTLWGAEFLICDYSDYERVAHLKEIPLLGGEKAILEPWRLGAMWLYMLYPHTVTESHACKGVGVYHGRLFNLNIEFVRKVDKRKWKVLYDMYRKNFNTPLASSMGRLFDAAASIVLRKYKVKFEAEAAIELEDMAKRYILTPKADAIHYDFRILKNRQQYILDPRPMFKQIVRDLERNRPKAEIAYRFHLTVAKMINRVCLKLRCDTGINTVVLSGGVFQNNLLLHLTLDLLYKDKFNTRIHKAIPCNDAGISLGQAIIANFKKG